MGNTARGGQGQPLSGIPCGFYDTLAVHIHAHLSLFVNGDQLVIPAGVGLVEPQVQDTIGFVYGSRCYYWLHTHDYTGIVHIEAPIVGRFTLGQFFDVWGQPLSTTNVAGFEGPVTAFVNGNRYAGDPNALTFAPQQQIVLQVGAPVITPPVYVYADGRRVP